LFPVQFFYSLVSVAPPLPPGQQAVPVPPVQPAATKKRAASLDAIYFMERFDELRAAYDAATLPAEKELYLNEMKRLQEYSNSIFKSTL